MLISLTQKLTLQFSANARLEVYNTPELFEA